MLRYVGFVVLCCTGGVLGADALQQAAEALAEDDYARAIPHLEAALQEDPANSNIRFNLAYAYQSSGDDQAARQHYRRVVSEQPDLLPARLHLAGLLLRAGFHTEAAAEFEACVAARPDDFAAHLALAAAYRGEGNREGAASAYRRALELDGNSLDALLGLAGGLAALGRVREAVPFYLRAAELEPSVAEGLPDIASRLESEGALAEALDLYRRYAQAHPQAAEPYESIGLLLLEGGDHPGAVDALERAVAAEPSANRHAALAEAYRRAGEPEASRRHLRLAAEAAPADAELRVQYANALLQEGEFERADAEYLAASRAQPQARDAWNGMAFARFQLQDYAAALQALQRAAELGPPAPASVYLRALAFDRLGAYEQAQAAYQAFLAADPGMRDEEWKAEQRLKTIAKVLAKR